MMGGGISIRCWKGIKRMFEIIFSAITAFGSEEVQSILTSAGESAINTSHWYCDILLARD